MRLIAALPLFICASIQAADTVSEKALAELLPKWTEAWIKSDVAGLMKLHHQDSKLRKAFDSSSEAKDGISKELLEMINQFGEIKSATMGKFIERKNRYVVKITYAVKGLVSGTMRLKPDVDGKLLVLDFNIDGQGEPELKE